VDHTRDVLRAQGWCSAVGGRLLVMVLTLAAGAGRQQYRSRALTGGATAGSSLTSRAGAVTLLSLSITPHHRTAAAAAADSSFSLMTAAVLRR